MRTINFYFLSFFTETSEHLLDKDPVPNGPSSLNAQNEAINGEESLCDQALKTMERSCEQTEPTTVLDRDSVTSLSQVTISLTSIMSGKVISCPVQCELNGVLYLYKIGLYTKCMFPIWYLG